MVFFVNYLVTFLILNLFITLGESFPTQTLNEDDHVGTYDSLLRMLPKDIINQAIDLATEIADEIKEDAGQVLELIKKCIESCISIDGKYYPIDFSPSSIQVFKPLLISIDF